MEIYQDYTGGIDKIDFCCHRMAEAILLREITTSKWTDHLPSFRLGDINISHCPFCGNGIKRKYDE